MSMDSSLLHSLVNFAIPWLGELRLERKFWNSQTVATTLLST